MVGSVDRMMMNKRMDGKMMVRWWMENDNRMYRGSNPEGTDGCPPGDRYSALIPIGAARICNRARDQSPEGLIKSKMDSNH